MATTSHWHEATRTKRRAIAIAALALVLAAALGRWLAERETVRTFAGPQLAWAAHGALEYFADEAIVRAQTGARWLEVEMPRGARPFTAVRVRVQLLAPWRPGARFYWIPEGNPWGTFEEGHAAAPQEVDVGYDHLELTLALDRPAVRLRFDPPEWAQLRIDRVEVRARPFSGALWRWGPFGIVALGLAGWWGRKTWRAAGGRAWAPAATIGLVAAAKLVLVSVQPLGAIGYMPHDDTLFLDRAEQLLAGRWLGPYDQFVLAKGPGFPLWIAASHGLGVPLRVGQHLGYLAAVALLVWALRPAVPGRWWPVALFAWLAFNPIGFSGDDTRVLRHDVATVWSVVAFAALTAVWLRPAWPGGRAAAWCMAGGLAFGMGWLTREDAWWMVPGVALLAGAMAVRAGWTRRWVGVRWATFAVVLPLLAGWAVPVAVVSALNAHHYGWWGTVEFRSREMRAAYGALLRVEPEEWMRFVPVRRETRERIYAASPAFASLRDYFEGPTGEAWARLGEGVTGRPAHEREIHGAAFMWALRDAVERAGHGGSAAEALAFYARLAAEVNGAVEAGVLAGGPPRSGFVPPWRREYTRALPGHYWRALDTLWRLPGWQWRPRRSEGEPERLAWVSAITRERVAPPVGVEWVPTAWDRARLRALDALSRPYRAGLRWLWALGVAGCGAAVVGAWRRRAWPAVLEPLVPAAAAGGGVLALCAVLALVDATSFHALTLSYLAPGYPLALAFPVLAGRAAWVTWRPGQQRQEGAR